MSPLTLKTIHKMWNTWAAGGEAAVRSFHDQTTHLTTFGPLHFLYLIVDLCVRFPGQHINITDQAQKRSWAESESISISKSYWLSLPTYATLNYWVGHLSVKARKNKHFNLFTVAYIWRDKDIFIWGILQIRTVHVYTIYYIVDGTRPSWMGTSKNIFPWKNYGLP